MSGVCLSVGGGTNPQSFGGVDLGAYLVDVRGRGILTKASVEPWSAPKADFSPRSQTSYFRCAVLEEMFLVSFDVQ